MTPMQKIVSMTDDILKEITDEKEKMQIENFRIMFLKYMQEERLMIHHAILHALDEDGHTGDWKYKFINNYIDKLYEKDNMFSNGS